MYTWIFIEGLIKVIEEKTFEHNYLKNGETQGSSKRAIILVKCPENNNLAIAIRHQVRDAGFCAVKGSETLSTAQRITIFR